MKNTLLIILICFNTIFCFSQPFPKKQTLIPLSNVNGVPFSKNPDIPDLYIDGFEIDKNGNFYFLGGEKLEYLAVFSNNKQIFRKTYKEAPGSQLYICKDNLYTLDREANKNVIMVLNPSNGVVIKTYHGIPNKHIDEYFFTDSSIIVGAMGDTAMSYDLYSLSGKYIKTAYNEYAIPSVTLPDKHCEFVGSWNDNYVFWGIPNEAHGERLWLINKQGKILAMRLLPNGFSGKGYAENPEEDRKVRNSSFYVLGKKGKYALITEVPLASFFGKQ